jgi:hypothetical protein
VHLTACTLLNNGLTSCCTCCRSATKWLHNGVYGDTTEMKHFAAMRAKFVCRDSGSNCTERAKRGDLGAAEPAMQLMQLCVCDYSVEQALTA